MRKRTLAIWVLIGAAAVWSLSPMAATAVHASQTATQSTSFLLAPMGHEGGHGCGHTSAGDPDTDDNNGVGHDDDHDHDCTEED